MRPLRALQAGFLSLVVIAAPLVLAADPAEAFPVSSCERIALQSTANQKYVSAEVSYTGTVDGMLRARADRIGPWEQFLLCDVTDLRFIDPQALFSDLQAANGWVTAEMGYTPANTYGGMMRARPDSSSVGEWEEFELVRNGCDNDCWSILSEYNQKWVSAELGYATTDYRYGMLRARAGALGSWEIFHIVRL